MLRYLREDTRGAVLVVGIVLGALLCGALFYLASVGDAILWREGVQDVADAAAFENAVWNARGMNVLVCVNIVMSMVLSVLVIWRIVMIAVAAAIGISAALCTIGIGCAPAVELSELEVDMLEADPRVADTIIRILSGMNVLEMGIASAVPVIGAAASSENTSRAYAGASPFALSASLLPNINAAGVSNAITCLGGGGKGEGEAGAAKGGSGSAKPSSGAGTKPDTGASGSKPGTGSGKVDTTKPGGASAADPCDAASTSSKPTGGKPRTSKPATKPTTPSSKTGGSGGGGSSGPLPGSWNSVADWGDFVSMRMGMPVSLPVQDGDYSLLCNKAAAFPLNNMAGVLEKALLAVGVNETLANFAVAPIDLGRNLMGVTAELMTGVFCAPLGTAPASIGPILDKSFNTLCGVEFEKDGKTKPAPGSSGGSGRGGTNLVKDDAKFLDADGVARKRSDWIKECARKKKSDMNKKLGGGLCAAEKAMPEIDCGKPSQVWDWSPNGSIFMRSFASASRPVDTRVTDQGLEVADADAIGNVRAVTPEGVRAHAEMYFECEGDWNGCSQSAMWEIRWRARLRRVQPMETLLADGAASALGGAIAQALKGLVSLDRVNELVVKAPGVWTELSENRIVVYVIEKVADALSDKLSWLAEAEGGLAGEVLDLFGSGFDGPTEAGDLKDSLLMNQAAPEHEDALRAFIRANAGRSATIH